MNWLLRVLGFALGAVVLVTVGVLVTLGEGVRHVVLEQPLWLLFALVPVVAVIVRSVTTPRPPSMRFSRKRTLDRLSGGFATLVVDLPDGLRLAAALLLVVVIARPQSTRLDEQVEHEGIDIAIALDLSESMANEDLYPNRLTAAQAVIDDFISRRPHDRIALVVFGANASTVAPLTLDHQVLRGLVARMRLGVMVGNSTAIGAGLGVALNRLEESDADSRLVVLLTDGVHNAAGVDPDAVAQKAAERGVKIYTILMGRHDAGEVSIDPQALERIASATKGYAYTAGDTEALQTSFQDLLNKLEKSTIASEHKRAELFPYFLWPILGLLMLDIGLRNTRLRRFP